MTLSDGAQRVKLDGRLAQLVGTLVADREAIERMRAGSVELHFGVGTLTPSLVLHDRRGESAGR